MSLFLRTVSIIENILIALVLSFRESQQIFIYEYKKMHYYFRSIIFVEKGPLKKIRLLFLRIKSICGTIIVNEVWGDSPIFGKATFKKIYFEVTYN